MDEADRNPVSALRTLDALVRAVERDLPKRVHDWQLEMTLHVKRLVQSAAGDHRASARTLQQITKQLEQQLQYAVRGLVGAYAGAALELAKSGERAEAARMLRKAAPWAVSLKPKDVLLKQAQKTVRALAARARIPGQR